MQQNRTRAGRSVSRELNRSRVLDVLKQHPQTSRAAIAKQTSLAKPTVSAIVDDLIEEGLAREIGISANNVGAGRPPMLLEFNPRSQFLVGVYLGIKSTTMSVADARGVELSVVERASPTGSPTSVLSQVADWIESELAAIDAPRERLGAVGVCVPGLVDVPSGVAVLAPNLGWQDVPVGETLRDALDVPVFVHNVAQAIAVAETLEGAAQGSTEVIAIYEDQGIGAGVISGGSLLHGAAGFTGEIGHCAIPGSTARCRCGKTGCLEAVASAAAMAAAVQRRLGRGALRRGSDLRAISRLEDPRATRVLREAGEAVGLGASWLVNLFNPEVLVLAGGFLDGGPALLEPLQRVTMANALGQSSSRLSIRASTLGRGAPVRGAVLLARQSSETYYRVIFQG